VKNYFRKHIYRWHRVTSLVVALPILMWSLSGFLHPVMNSFKPEVRNQSLPLEAMDTSKISVSLHDALQGNGIRIFHKFRIVKLGSDYYYQIQQLDNDSLTYLGCADGTLLTNGDALYAEYLAQRYLSEPSGKEKPAARHVHELAASIIYLPNAAGSTGQYLKAGIKSTELVTEFDDEYKSSNMLLPVYCVSFDRSDDIRLYIETSTDRLATAIDSKKAWFIHFFAMAHTWSFLDGMGQTKQVILGVFALLCFITSLLGFFVYNVTKRKNASSTVKWWHRTLGNVFVVTTALYGLSGAWHALYKLSDQSKTQTVKDHSEFTTDEIKGFSIGEFRKTMKRGEKMNDVSIVKMNGENYWQLFMSKGKERQRRYIRTSTLQELTDGDVNYGCYLACQFAQRSNQSIAGGRSIARFTPQYSMMNKRLPVVEVSFKENEKYYVETATGQLSTFTSPYSTAERFSFSNLHMHHYWEDWFHDNGKPAQKALLISSTLGLLLLALTGSITWWRRKRRSTAL
jgi:uncharacterized membrane protein YsdA (DUF1294 family)